MAIAALFQIGSLGDSLVSLPALRSLREVLPDVTEYLLITRVDGKQQVSPREVFDMADRCRYHATYLGSAPALRKALSVVGLIAKLRWMRPKYAVYLLPSDRTEEQVQRDRTFFRASGVRNLVGFRNLSSAELSAGENAGVQRTEAFLRFRRLWGDSAAEHFRSYAGIPLVSPPASAISRAREWLAGARRFPERRLVALAPFSNWESRDLSKQVVAQVATRLERELTVEVLFMGGNKDREAVESIRSESSAGVNACGLFSIQESAAAIRECELLVGADSGPMHLAGALGVPVVA